MRAGRVYAMDVAREAIINAQDLGGGAPYDGGDVSTSVGGRGGGEAGRRWDAGMGAAEAGACH